MLSFENAEIAKVTCEPCVVLAVLYFQVRSNYNFIDSNPKIENIEYSMVLRLSE